MKLFNPFRWHIAKNSADRFTVRKFSLFWGGWRYLDRDCVYRSWNDAYSYKYCVVYTLEDAERLLELSRGFKAI